MCKFMHKQIRPEASKGVSDPLEMELQVLGSCLEWMLGTKLRSSEEQGMLLDTGPFLQVKTKETSTFASLRKFGKNNSLRWREKAAFKP